MGAGNGDLPQTNLLDRIFPPQCLLCGALVQSGGGLCGACWRDTPFILGVACDQCGAPLIGEDPGIPIRCDDCRAVEHPWRKGRSVMVYDGGTRRLVLALKHGDRLDLVPAVSGWMAARAGPLLDADTLVVPVPVHWRRLLRRRYNQAAVLALALAKRLGLPCVPDLLRRARATPVQDGMGVEARYANLDGAIKVTDRYGRLLNGRSVLLVDDVMTSGATLSVCAEVCVRAGAAQVNVLTLARVVRDT
ncbi:ComF family protein [Pseudoruegeria sp. SK021]|uniref:ComF family protein n=1 Tax=Pseudoruegeria sp. SK021 TaxID=1933035 RepID=UPI000A238975|nr:ComF family protein [Pseudoruegeria sp. SK021]OSP54670.1 amidophosphoribosyltransferase [Pseudoruegeria sp. SK021]